MEPGTGDRDGPGPARPGGSRRDRPAAVDVGFGGDRALGLGVTSYRWFSALVTVHRAAADAFGPAGGRRARAVVTLLRTVVAPQGRSPGRPGGAVDTVLGPAVGPARPVRGRVVVAQRVERGIMDAPLRVGARAR